VIINRLKGIQQGLWAIAAALIFLALCYSLTEKPRYLPADTGRVLDTYTGQQFVLRNKRSEDRDPTLKFGELTEKITD